jgi:hypothetical protein
MKPDTRNVYQRFGDEARRDQSSMLLFDAYPELTSLIEALRRVDESKGTDKAALIRVLRSTGSMRNKLLADLFERYDLVRPKRRCPPVRPAYVMSDEELLLAKANGDVDRLMEEEELSIHEAIAQAALKHGVRRNQLRDFRAGRSRSVRKRKI